MGGDVRHRLKTLKHKLLAIPAIVQQSADKVIVKMALHMNQMNLKQASLCGNSMQYYRHSLRH